MQEKLPLQLNRTYSILFLVFYGGLTMAFRFYLEPYLKGNFFLSVGIGLGMLAILYFLVKIGILNFQKPGDKTDN